MFSAAFRGKSSSKSVEEPITKRHVSFGCELEFFVACLEEGTRDPDEGRGLPPAVRLPLIESNRDHEQVWDALEDVLRDAGLPVSNLAPEAGKAKSTRTIHSDLGSEHATAFTVSVDHSLHEPNVSLGGYLWQAVEVTTPALWNKQVHFDMVRLAVNTITTSFRVRVNPTCGFHVHVGMGAGQRIDARTLRRFGAFLWAATPLLYTLHSPDRRVARYSRSIRDFDITPLGETTSDDTGVARRLWNRDDLVAMRPCARRLGRIRFLGEPFEPEGEPVSEQHTAPPGNHQHMAPPTTEGARGEHVAAFCDFGPPGRIAQDEEHVAAGVHAAPKAKFKAPVATYRPEASSVDRGRLRRLQDKADDPSSGGPPRPGAPVGLRTMERVPLPCPAQKDELTDHVARSHSAIKEQRLHGGAAVRADVMSAVREILAGSFSSAMVAELLQNTAGNKLQCFNWEVYMASQFGRDAFQGKTTVEIRMGSATMDEDWVVAWAGICARMLEYCRDADEAEWLRVIRALAWAQEEAGPYDVLDLLEDIGAFEHVRAAEARLREVDVGGGGAGGGGGAAVPGLRMSSMECPTASYDPEPLDGLEGMGWSSSDDDIYPATEEDAEAGRAGTYGSPLAGLDADWRQEMESDLGEDVRGDNRRTGGRFDLD